MWPDLYIYFNSFFFGCLRWGLWFEILVILEVGHPGHLKVGVRVLLCFTYRFVMPGFGGRNFVFLGETGNPGNWLLWFLNSLGGGGMCWGWATWVTFYFFVTSVLGATTAIGFWSFWVFLCIRKIELEGSRVVAKESHSFIWWVAIVNPGKEVWDETMPSL